MFSPFNRVQLFVTLWPLARQAPLSVEFSKQGYWSALSCPPLGNLPDPGIKPASLVSPALQGEDLPPSHRGAMAEGDWPTMTSAAASSYFLLNTVLLTQRRRYTKNFASFNAYLKSLYYPPSPRENIETQRAFLRSHT